MCLDDKDVILPASTFHHRNESRMLLESGFKVSKSEAAAQRDMPIVLCRSDCLGRSYDKSGYGVLSLPVILEEDEESLSVQKSLDDCYDRIQLLREDALYLESLLLPAKPKPCLKRSAGCILDRSQPHHSCYRSLGHLSDSAFIYFYKSKRLDTWSLRIYRQFSSFSSSHINRMISYLQVRLRAVREEYATTLSTSLSKEQESFASVVLDQISQVSACISRIWRLYLSRSMQAADPTTTFMESGKGVELPLISGVDREGNGKESEVNEEWISLYPWNGRMIRRTDTSCCCPAFCIVY